MILKLDISDQATAFGRRIFLALIMLSVTASLSAGERYWQARDVSARGQPLSAHRYTLDEAALRARLAQAPYETLGDRSLTVMLPMPDGSLAQFAAVESPIMEPGLAADFPEIKTYKLFGIEDPTASGRLSLTRLGVHGALHTATGRVMIDPDRIPGSYVARNRREASGEDIFSCGVYDIDQSTRPRHSPIASRTAARVTGMLLTYRLAVAATEEYVDAVTPGPGGNVVTAQAEIVVAVNRVNEIYERDLGIRLLLVAGNQNLLESGGNVSFSNFDAFAMFGENQAWIDGQIGSGAYDIGHVFSTGGGGLAVLGSVCDNASKAQGVTGQSIPLGDPFHIDFVAHEIGHQFNADHSFNGTTNACTGGNRWPPTAVEPGSGSTIMAYAGICGAENLQNNSDATFHAISIGQIDAFANGLIGTCGVQIDTEPVANNMDPTITPVPDYTIPIGTPFALDAVASDVDIPGDMAQTLTYQWDQMDTGDATNSSDFGTDKGNNPLFRSYLPQTESRRDFPALGTQVQNQFDDAEVIPCTTRALDFRLTVRDQVSGQAVENVRVNTTNQAGPFLITSFGSPAVIDPTVTNTLTWNVANTDGMAVGCSNVDIDLLVFLDAGYTRYSVHNLMLNQPNNGSRQIVFPDTTLDAQYARFRLSCSNNVFYDVSDANLNINGTSANTYSNNDFATFFNTGLTTGVLTPSCGAGPGELQFSSANYGVGEGDGFVLLTVVRTGGSDGAVSVQYATSDGSAAAGSDYTMTSGTLNFADGVTAQGFLIPIADDALDEPNETVNITLSNPMGAPVGFQDTAVLTIIDNDISNDDSEDDDEDDGGSSGGPFNPIPLLLLVFLQQLIYRIRRQSP